MYLFDNLPLDIILHEIIPNLDFLSRIVVNCMLPPADRIRRPLDKKTIKKFELHFAKINLLKLLRQYNKQKISHETFLKELSIYASVLKYDKHFREGFIILMGDFMSREVSEILLKPL
jgi:hypothetical protein